MLFRVDTTSVIGLADQIAAQIRGALVSGRLRPGDRLPAARDVAAGLDVNMHTVLRAYATVRDEGLIELRRGRGAVVRGDVDPAALALQDRIADLARAALSIGWSAADTADAVARAMHTMTQGRAMAPGRPGPAPTEGKDR